MTIKKKDNGAGNVINVIGKSASVRIGIIGNGSDRNEGASNAEIGAIHEFGIGVPRRSFIRGWHDENIDKIKKMMKNVAIRCVDTGDFVAPLEVLGLSFVGDIQERISNRIEPPLSEATIRRKNSSVPLIDTGQLRTSITYKVEKR